MDTTLGTARIRSDPPRAYVSLRGELDLAVRRTVTAQLSDAVAAGCVEFRFDLGEVSFCDAGTIGLIVGLERRVRAEGGSVTIVAASSCVRRVLELVGLAGMLGAGPTGAEPWRSRPDPLPAP